MINNIFVAIQRWMTTTETGNVVIKLAAIGATVWLLWCIFSYLWHNDIQAKKKPKTQDERESETW